MSNIPFNFDEIYHNNIHQSISNEHDRIIKENIINLEKSAKLDKFGSLLSFAGIFCGPIGKTTSFFADKAIDELKNQNTQQSNGEIIKIVKNRESFELLKTLNNIEQNQQTNPSVLILSELTQRHQMEIEELTKKYDKHTIQNILQNQWVENNSTQNLTNSANSANSANGTNEDFEKKIDTLIQWTNGTIDIKTRNEYLDTFSSLSKIGEATNCVDLAISANLALGSINIYNSVEALSSGLSSGSFISVINPITSILCVGLGLFGLFKKSRKKSNDHMTLIANITNTIIKQLDLIKNQLIAVQIEMRENFQNIFKYLDFITEKLQSQYILSINIYHKITNIENSIRNTNTLVEYYGKQNLLQNLHRTVYKIFNGTTEYFQSITQNDFNNLFMDLIYCIENQCCDHGTNGYIYSMTSPNGNIVSNLKSKITERLGYLGHLLKFPQSEQLVNPELLYLCVNALEILIFKGLHYSTLPISHDRFGQIISKINTTNRFFEYSKQPIVLNALINAYSACINNLSSHLNSWINSIAEKYELQSDFHYSTIHQIVREPIKTDIIQVKVYYYSSNIPVMELPVKLHAHDATYTDLWKYCELATRLNIGHFDCKIMWMRTDRHFFRYHDCDIIFNYILNGTKYELFVEKWGILTYSPNDNGNVANFWNLTHEYTKIGEYEHVKPLSASKVLVSYTSTNQLYARFNIKDACDKKIISIKNEITNITFPIGTAVNTSCDKIQEQYIIISKLFEINNLTIGNDFSMLSGSSIKHALENIINFRSYGPAENRDILTYCNFIKSKIKTIRLDVPESNTTVIQGQDLHSSLEQKVSLSIETLEKLSIHMIKHQENCKFIETMDEIHCREYEKITQREKYLNEKQNNSVQEQAVKNINQIGFEIGRILTIQNILNQLRKNDNCEEATILETHFQNELVSNTNSQIEVINHDHHSIPIFNSSFCNGCSMVLLEMSFELRDYPHTMMQIQNSGYTILNKIIKSPTISITNTMSMLTFSNET